ncbi:MAG: 5-carboxymethyl-2-hydroxymuconate Delta-isomerase [Gammaproteobacteria bacterium]|nr:5-carboxymethyl-2-hydroxymuconate Delta-isomerase [Gammaproteobacteria bacterium]MCW8986584.1 5-carboxymethyl-2-hydroxymuconate Delta-isomerase [Gammaproteobacteria bacterium]
MPHIIIEYAEQVADKKEIDEMLQAIHHAIAESGLFKADQIKTRAYPFRRFTHAGENDPYIHIQARIKSGRDADNKKQFGKVILSAFDSLAVPVSVITVEVIDMDRNSYAKYVPDK